MDKEEEKDSNSSTNTVMHSSIALLQERFRQLQRVKEMREERAVLMRMLQAEPNKQLNHLNPTMHYDHQQPYSSSRLPSKSESLSNIPQSSSPPHASRSIRPQSSSYSQTTNQTPSDPTSFNKFNDYDHSHPDVDTSLHL
jgi:hypothetical protein